MRNQRNREDRTVRRNDGGDDTRSNSRRSDSDDMERSAGQGTRRGGMNMPANQSRPTSRSRKKK
jgi:hypothetical protein